MGRVIDMKPALALKRLKRTEQWQTAHNVARWAADRIGVKPTGVMYRQYITRLPSADHIEAVLLFALAEAPELLQSNSGYRELAERVDAHVRRVIPKDVFWSHV